MASQVRWENERSMMTMEEVKRLGRAKRLMRMRSVSWGEKETHLNEMEMNFQLSIKEETSGVHCSSNCELDEACRLERALLNIEEEQQKDSEQAICQNVSQTRNVPIALDLSPCCISDDKHPIQLWKLQGYQSTMNLLSALYGIILVVMGVAFPISQVISSKIPSSYYEGFYVYLYSAAIVFLAYVYCISSTFDLSFLLVTNFAMWAVITLEKSRFDAHPVQSNFFGKWPWAIITNVSTPLAIFYRYHSTVCLCEIWKRCYKINVLHQNSRSPATLRSNSSSFTN